MTGNPAHKVLCKWIILCCRFFSPFSGFSLVFFYTDAVEIKHAQCYPCLGIPLCGGFFIPFYCAVDILFEAVAEGIHLSQLELCFGVARFRFGLPAFHFFDVVRRVFRQHGGDGRGKGEREGKQGGVYFHRFSPWVVGGRDYSGWGLFAIRFVYRR